MTGSNFNFPWLLKMAWRDSRRNRSRLFLFVSSIVLGIAAMVAIYSLGDNMSSEIDRQAATLLGADLEISSNKEVSEGVRKMADSLGDRRSEQQSFTSMIYFPKNEGTRLVQVRALGGDFLTLLLFRSAEQWSRPVDEDLLKRPGVSGDSIF